MVPMQQRRVGLYGGTFDPVHAGHLAVARALLDWFTLAKVLFIPAHIAPHKRMGRHAPAHPLHRYAMLALATQSEPQLQVSPVELDAPERPYTVETLARLQIEFGAATRLYFVMGADSWADITTWRAWAQLLLMSDHIVMARPGYAFTTAHVGAEVQARIVDLRGRDRQSVAVELAARTTPHIYFTDAVRADVSATAIRQAAGTSAGVGPQVPAVVAEYIRKYELYKDRHDERNDGTRAAHDD